MKKYQHIALLSWDNWQPYLGSTGSIRDTNNPLDWCVDTFGPGRKKSRWMFEYTDIPESDAFETTFKFTDEKDYIHFMLRWG